MSTTSMKSDFLVQAFSRDEVRVEMSSEVPRLKPRLARFFSLQGWPRQLFETLALLAVVTLLQRWSFGAATPPGLPHPYLLPVLLVSSQYGMSGGLCAAAAASLMYWLGFSTPSAAQDFHAYAGTFAVQPAMWLATALVIGGLRSLHIHQFLELGDQLAAGRGRGHDIARGLERAIAEINALERRIATDTSSIAAFSRGLADIDLSDRRTVAASWAELFRIGTGTSTFTIYLRDSIGYVPVCAVEQDTICSTHGLAPLSPATIAEMASRDTAALVMGDAADGELCSGRYVVPVAPGGPDSSLLAVIVCELHASQEWGSVRRRAGELGRALGTLLNACPDQVLKELA